MVSRICGPIREGTGKAGCPLRVLPHCSVRDHPAIRTLYSCWMILLFPLSVMIGEPNCQNTWFPLPVTVMLLQEPSRVTVFACPLISASLPLQVKVKV